MNLEVRKNFEEKVSYHARSLPGMTIKDQGNFLSVDCGLPSDTFNVTVTRNLSAAAEVLTLSVDHFTSKGFPMALWYWENEIDKAGVSELLIGSQTAGIYDIATHPEYRRRGIGSSMFQYLLLDACTSQHRFCILQASHDGFRIYEQAGFSAVGKVHVFENRRLL